MPIVATGVTHGVPCFDAVLGVCGVLVVCSVCRVLCGCYAAFFEPWWVSVVDDAGTG